MVKGVRDFERLYPVTHRDMFTRHVFPKLTVTLDDLRALGRQWKLDEDGHLTRWPMQSIDSSPVCSVKDGASTCLH